MDQHWDDLVKQFCSISDRLGMPIDDEIFDTVIALNALSITTTMSCAGHITRDEGDRRYPWVDFSTSDTSIEDLKKKQEDLHKKADQLQSKLTRLRKKNADSVDTKPYDAGQEWSVPVTENLAKSRESEYD